MDNNPMGNSPMANGPMSNHAVGSNPMSNNPMGNSPIGNNPIGSHPMAGNMGSSPIGNNMGNSSMENSMADPNDTADLNIDAPSDLQDIPDMAMSLVPPPEGTYPDRSSLLQSVQAHGKAHGYNIVVKSSSTPTDKKPGRTAKVWLRCDRGGQYRPRNGLTEETRKRKRSSRLMDCPFMLVAAGHPGIWTLTVLNPTHNHGPIVERPRQAPQQRTKKGQVKAVPYDWPHDATFTPFTTAFVIIDMQRDLYANGGYMDYSGFDISHAQSLVPKIHRVLNAFRSAGFPVYFTRQGHRPDLSTLSSRESFRSQHGQNRYGIGADGPLGRLLIRGEPGHDIIEDLYPIINEPIVDKPGRSAFAFTDFELLLRNKGIKNLVLAGLPGDLSVSTTMREANDKGMDCVVLEDGNPSPEHLGTPDSLRMEAEVFGAIATIDDMIQAIDNFKSVTVKKLTPSIQTLAG